MTDSQSTLALILAGIAAIAAVGTFLQTRVVLALVAVAIRKRAIRKQRRERQRQAERIRMFAQDSPPEPETVVHLEATLTPAAMFRATTTRCGSEPSLENTVLSAQNTGSYLFLELANERHTARSRKETWDGGNPCSGCLYLIATDVESGGFPLGRLQF